MALIGVNQRLLAETKESKTKYVEISQQRITVADIHSIGRYL